MPKMTRLNHIIFLLIALWGLALGVFANAEAQGLLPTQWQRLDKGMLVWGNFTIPSSVLKSDTNNAKFEAYAKPNIRLWRLGRKTKITGYFIVAALSDKLSFDYNNKLKFAVGLELQHKLTKAVRLSFGVKWDNEYRYLSGATYNSMVATADMSIYNSWKPVWLRKGRLSDAKLVLSGWANFRYPGALDPSERHNALLQGSLKLAVVVPIGNSKLKLAPFVSITAKADTKKRPWNNTLEPAFGLALKIPLGKRGALSVGVKSAVQLRYLSGKVESGGLVYLSWYKHF